MESYYMSTAALHFKPASLVHRWKYSTVKLETVSEKIKRIKNAHV